MERPIVSLDEYLAQELSNMISKFTPLICIMYEFRFDGNAHFYKTIAIAIRDEKEKIEYIASNFWGKLDVREKMGDNFDSEKIIKKIKESNYQYEMGVGYVKTNK